MNQERNTETVPEILVNSEAQRRDKSRLHKFNFHRSRPKHMLLFLFILSILSVVLLAFSFESNVINYLIAPNVIITIVLLVEIRNRQLYVASRRLIDTMQKHKK